MADEKKPKLSEDARRVLEVLRQRPSGAPGWAIARDTAMGRPAMWKAVHELVELGYAKRKGAENVFLLAFGQAAIDDDAKPAIKSESKPKS